MVQLSSRQFPVRSSFPHIDRDLAPIAGSKTAFDRGVRRNETVERIPVFKWVPRHRSDDSIFGRLPYAAPVVSIWLSSPLNWPTGWNQVVLIRRVREEKSMRPDKFLQRILWISMPASCIYVKGHRNVVRRVKPDSFQDILSLRHGSTYRPGRGRPFRTRQ